MAVESRPPGEAMAKTSMNSLDYARMTGREFRSLCRNGEWSGHTAGAAVDYVQANLAILPSEYAADFEAFCRSNPKPCPILEVLETGNPAPAKTANDADIRTDLALYRVYRGGELSEEPSDISSLWDGEMVAFLIGCSFTFEKRLAGADIPLRHIECGVNVPMYVTNIRCEPVGSFSGPLVVSMRPIPMDQVAEATRITGQIPQVHGSPVHTGAPEAIGIKDISQPDFGDPVLIKDGEVPAFWACGVTPQAVAFEAKLPLMITHSPGHMFVTDVLEAYVERFFPAP